MATFLKIFVINHPDVTLSHTEYRQQFYLGCGVNISSTPSQCVLSFVENEGSPYRFMIVGQLMSFKVIEDAVCVPFLLFHFLQKTHHPYAIGI